MTKNTKYAFTSQTKTIEKNNKKITLKRIIALKDFGNVRKGEIGGWLESEHNLSFEGNSWVADNAKVFSYATVYDDAEIHGNAEIYDRAKIYLHAKVYDNAKVFDMAEIYGSAEISDHAQVYEYAEVSACSQVWGYATVYGDAFVYGDSRIYGNAKVYGDAKIFENASVYEDAKIFGDAYVHGFATIIGDAIVSEIGDYIVFNNSWSSNRYFTWTKSNDMWKVGCFHGTGKELIKKAYQDSEESGHNYQLYVKLVKELKTTKEG